MNKIDSESFDRQDKGVARDSLSAKIYSSLRSDLMNGLYGPGERLNIRQLADTYQTSATPVREAMMQLVREGGLELRTGHQLSVPILSLERYTNIREVRIPLERIAAERAAARITKAEIEQLEKLNAAWVSAEENKKWKEALALNKEFHFTIYRASDNDVLLSAIENLWLLSGPFINNQYPGARLEYGATHPHPMLIDALKRRDPAEAGEMVVQDLRHGSHLILEKLKSDPQYQGSRKRVAENIHES